MPLTILDTNILNELRKPKRHPALVAWLAGTPGTDLVVSAPSLVEIARGIALLESRDPPAAAQLQPWLEHIVATRRILPLDADAAVMLGRMTTIPALRNLLVTHPGAVRPQLGADLAIAAIAIVNNAAVATRNLRYFRLIAVHFPALTVVAPHGSVS
jgi:predicted nucleic acid-binding protein